MSYNKIFVDNVSCSRRFHLNYFDDDEKQPRVEIKCPFCDLVIFAEDNHPPVTLARQENLTKTTDLADRVVRDCEFADRMTKAVFSKQ